MSTTEAGDPLSYPTSITIPSDGDGPSIKAADVNVAFEGLADRTAFMKAMLSPINGYAALAALSVSGLASGTLRYVTGFGFYRFTTPGTISASQYPHLVKPSSGTGFWTREVAYRPDRIANVELAAVTETHVSGSWPAAASTVAFVTAASTTTQIIYSPTGTTINSGASDGTKRFGGLILLDSLLRDHDGMTLEEVSLWFALFGGGPTPAPALGVFRRAKVTAYGAALEPLLSTGSGIASSASSPVIVSPDQNNVIDLTGYTYHARVFDGGQNLTAYQAIQIFIS